MELLHAYSSWRQTQVDTLNRNHEREFAIADLLEASGAASAAQEARRASITSRILLSEAPSSAAAARRAPR
eukprot:scaffold350299_cov36-Prasinocladus_malaysianus.AAC.1